MKNRDTLSTSVLVAMLAFMLTGCMSSKNATDTEAESGANTEQDAYADDFKSNGIAAAASRNVNWASTIDGKEADDQPFSFTEQLLHGQVAGVTVLNRPGGGFSVQIRGVNSFMGGTEPLYIVDGMPVLHKTGSGLSWLNTRDIKKIEIVKDIDGKALYGARGANGVVIITTKLGPQDDNEDDEYR